LTQNDFLTYFGKERLQLPARVIDKTLAELHKSRSAWGLLIADSFLSKNAKERYLKLLNERFARIFF
jgi:hypothetical protein